MKLLSVMLVSAVMASGQAATAAPPKPVLKANPGDVVKMLKPTAKPDQYDGYSSISNVLNGLYPVGSGVSIVYDSLRKAFVVRGPASAVKLVEDTFKQLDSSAKTPVTETPSPNVEMIVQLVYASTKEDAKGGVPADLQATVQQLRSLFPYASYRVLDTWLQHGRDGSQMQDEGTVAGGGTLPGNAPVFYTLQYTPVVSQTTGARSVRLRGLRMSLRQNIPGSAVGTSISINTDIDAHEGQKTVVGKGNVGGSEDAMFLIVSPKVVQ